MLSKVIDQHTVYGHWKRHLDIIRGPLPERPATDISTGDMRLCSTVKGLSNRSSRRNLMSDKEAPPVRDIVTILPSSTGVRDRRADYFGLPRPPRSGALESTDLYYRPLNVASHLRRLCYS